MTRVLDGLLKLAPTGLKRKPSRITDKRTERVGLGLGVGMSERRTMCCLGGRVNECAVMATQTEPR